MFFLVLLQLTLQLKNVNAIEVPLIYMHHAACDVPSSGPEAYKSVFNIDECNKSHLLRTIIQLSVIHVTAVNYMNGTLSARLENNGW